MKVTTINGTTTLEHGQSVKCSINDEVVIGAIYILSDRRAWICHNESSLNGDEAPNRFGFNYSWVFSPDSHSDVKNLKPMLNEPQYKDNEIEKDFVYLLEQIIGYEKLQIAFYHSLKPFENYKKVLKSTKPGYILLQGKFDNGDKKTTKNVEIKLSRYLKKMSDAYTEYRKSKGFLLANPIFTDSDIEQINNKFVGYSTGDNYKLEFLSGDDINFGYTSENYAKRIGTLGKSCMSDRTEFLDIYRKNENCSLAVLKVTNLIDARCLIWEINGTKYYDRIYYTADWICEAMQKKLNEAGCKPVSKLREGTEIILKENEFEAYPYIDTFRYQLQGTNRFFNCITNNQPRGIYKCFGATNGAFSLCDVTQ